MRAGLWSLSLRLRVRTGWAALQEWAGLTPATESHAGCPHSWDPPDAIGWAAHLPWRH